MAVWARIKQIAPEIQERIFSLYKDNFPREIRFLLRYWIEEQNWNALDPDNPAHEAEAEKLMKEFHELIYMEMISAEQSVSRYSVDMAARGFKEKYEKPLEAVRAIKKCLEGEKKLLEEEETRQKRRLESYTPEEIQSLIEELYKCLMKTNAELGCLKVGYETLLLEKAQAEKFESDLQANASEIRTPEEAQQSKDKLRSHLCQLHNSWLIVRRKVLDNIKSSCEQLRSILKILDNQLKLWKKEQRSRLVGFEIEDNLNQIQEWYEKVAEISLRIRNHMIKFQLNDKKCTVGKDESEQVSELESVILFLLTSLVKRSLVVEQQPKQVLSTCTEFQATVRLLITPILGFVITPPFVKMRIISESQAAQAEVREPDIKDEDTYGKIMNNESSLDYCDTTKTYKASFHRLYMTDFRRVEKSNQGVTEQKYYMLFEVLFKLDEKKFAAWTTSAPIVVVDNASQEIDAAATIFWDNAFAELSFQLVLSKNVSWQQLADVLTTYFKDATGRRLSDDDLSYLFRKMFSDRSYYTTTVTWVMFAQDTLPDSNFTFWQWFYSVLKLTGKHLTSLWQKRHLIGFIERKKAEEMLKTQPFGTFILRFSDSVLGGVSISCSRKNRATGAKEVISIEPMSCQDLEMKCLEDRVREMNLSFIYPSVPVKEMLYRNYVMDPFKRISFERAHSIDDNEPNVRRSSGSEEPSIAVYILNYESSGPPSRNFASSNHESAGPSRNYFPSNYEDAGPSNQEAQAIQESKPGATPDNKS